MNKSVLSIGIVLSLGTAGCAGFGLQQSSSLGAQYQQERGVDPLWTASEQAPARGLETPRYAQQSLGGLWDRGVEAPEGALDDSSAQRSTGGDLWNPASVSRSWEISEEPNRTPSRGILFGESVQDGIWY